MHTQFKREPGRGIERIAAENRGAYIRRLVIIRDSLGRAVGGMVVIQCRNPDAPEDSRTRIEFGDPVAMAEWWMQTGGRLDPNLFQSSPEGEMPYVPEEPVIQSSAGGVGFRVAFDLKVMGVDPMSDIHPAEGRRADFTPDDADLEKSTWGHFGEPDIQSIEANG